MKSEANTLDRYPGNKSSSSMYPIIINNIPRHRNYYELYAGSAAVAKKLYSPVKNSKLATQYRSEKIILNDKSESVVRLLKQKFPEDVAIINFSAVAILDQLTQMYQLPLQDQVGDFVYLDPPYLFDSRRGSKDLYEHEMNEADHIALLEQCIVAPFNCMISHYPCEVYNDYLSSFHMVKFQVSTHAGVATEALYMNYDISKLALASYAYIGHGRTNRQQINRKQKSLLNKILNLPDREREKLLHQMRFSLNKY